MHFGKALYRFIDCILAAPPNLGPNFLNKVDLADAYILIWVLLEDIPSVAFLVPKATPEQDQLVGFHLSIPMGYVESAAFFCTTTDTVKYLILDSLSTRRNTPPHHLEDSADTKLPQTSVQNTDKTLKSDNDWEALSLHARATSLAHVEVYIYDFIGIVQGGQT